VRGKAQDNGFCDAMNAVMRDAPNQFRNVRGKMQESNMNAIIWHASIQLPGALNCRFVSALGLFYEAGVYQTTDKEELKPYYEKYKNMLGACLFPQGYKLSFQPNFYAGLGDFKKLVFMQDPQNVPVADTLAHASQTAPPHVTMEVDYNPKSGKFTIVIFIFEH
jgi:hypothetical protein